MCACVCEAALRSSGAGSDPGFCVDGSWVGKGRGVCAQSRMGSDHSGDETLGARGCVGAGEEGGQSVNCWRVQRMTSWESLRTCTRA